jgi:hypothetical protein
MRRSTSTLVVAVWCSFVANTGFAQEQWQVWVEGREATRLAMPRASGNGIFVDVKALAPALGLSVEVRPDAIVIRTRDGVEWTGRETTTELHASGQSLRLPAPVLGIGDAVYVDVETVARLSGLSIKLRPEQLRVDFVAPGTAPVRRTATAAPFVGPPRTFQVAKTTEEIAAGRYLDPEDVFASVQADAASVLPRRHDRFTLGTAFGYVPGKDGATEVTGTGRIHGFEGDVNAFVTLGDRGPEWYHGRVALRDHDSGRALFAGDMVSETRGLSRGARFSWLGARGRKPAISIYRPRFPHDGDRTVISYRDQFVFSRQLLAEGEMASDRSAIAKLRLNTRHLNGEAYHHRGPSGRDLGVTAAADVWRGFGIGGAARSSEGPQFAERFRQAYVKLPLWHQANVRLERTHVELSTNKSHTNAAVLTMPVGPVHLLARWQDRDLETFSQYGQARVAERGLMAAASYAPSRRVRLNLQIANEWLRDGRVRDFQEVTANVQATAGTLVQATAALTNVDAVDRVRIRVSQRLRRDLSLVAEIGRFSAFQAPVVAGDAFPSRFKVFVRKDWNVASPARGGRVSGRITDQLGSPIAGVVVRLGSYQTVTSGSGSYVFDRVPRGEYKLRLDPDRMPASYGTSEGERRLTVRPGTHATEDFVLAPLNVIHGRVYVDRNENGQLDQGEELGGVVMRIGDKLTRSGLDGGYAFYNLMPGVYRVEVLLDRVTPDHELRTPASIEVVLEAGRPSQIPDVRLVPRRKPILFQHGRARR